MKVTHKDLPGFSPFTLTIAFETEQEAMAFQALFYVRAIIRATPALAHPAIRAALEDRMAPPSQAMEASFCTSLRANLALPLAEEDHIPDALRLF